MIVPGNHDHHLLEGWFARRRLEGAAPLGLEERAPIAESGPLRAVAEGFGDRAEIAYPGVWVRPDTYATHGHYLDRHLTIPTFERLALAAVERALGPAPDAATDPLAAPTGPTDPDEYERAQAPVYAFLFALAQGAGAGRRGPGPSARLWAAMSGGATRAQRLRGWLLGSVALPSAVGVANRLGLGPVRPDLSVGAVTRAGISAIGEVAARLGIEADHLIFGHTHRRGPLDGEHGWRTPGGAQPAQQRQLDAHAGVDRPRPRGAEPLLAGDRGRGRRRGAASGPAVAGVVLARRVGVGREPVTGQRSLAVAAARSLPIESPR